MCVAADWILDGDRRDLKMLVPCHPITTLLEPIIPSSEVSALGSSSWYSTKNQPID